MAQLNIRLDDESRDLLDALARARGLNTSDLVRDLIAQALGRDNAGHRGDGTTPRSLSAVQRRALAMQHQILAILTADDEEGGGGWESSYHRQMVELLDAGYTSEYYQTFQMIQPEMSDRECDLVHDILEMFTQLEWSVEQLSPAALEALGDHASVALSFRGFDFNHSLEGRLASYAQFLINDGKYESLARRFDASHERGNSHAPMLAAYQRMLSVWKPIWEKKIRSFVGPDSYRFTTEELRRVVAAWPYPKG